MNTKNILFAFGIGLTVGAGVALLYAPQTGVVTRKKLKRSAEDASDYLEDTAEYLKEQAEHISSEAEKFLKKARSTVDDAVDQAGGIVSGALKTAQKLI
jgi:gas vesicle protein